MGRGGRADVGARVPGRLGTAWPTTGGRGWQQHRTLAPRVRLCRRIFPTVHAVPGWTEAQLPPGISSKRHPCHLPSPPQPHSSSSLPNKPPAPSQFLDSSSASQGPLSGDRGCGRQSHLLASYTSIHPPHLSSQARPQAPFTCSISQAQADRWVASPTDGEIVWAKHVNPCSAWPSPDGSRDLLGGPGEVQQAFPAPAPHSTGRPLHFPKPSVVPVPCHQPRVSPRTLSRLHQPSFVHEGNLDSRGQECALPMSLQPPAQHSLNNL